VDLEGENRIFDAFYIYQAEAINQAPAELREREIAARSSLFWLPGAQPLNRDCFRSRDMIPVRIEAQK
jgi:hypothetical protein